MLTRPVTQPLTGPLARGVGEGGLRPIRNLLTKTQAFDDAIWLKTATTTVPTITPDADTAPDGTLTADQVNIADSLSAISEAVVVLPSTQYVFSFYAKRGTMSNMKYSVFNNTALSNIVGATTYFALTNASTYSRISVAFTTPAGCTSINVYPSRDPASTGNFFLWGAQLELGATASTYQARL